MKFFCNKATNNKAYYFTEEYVCLVKPVPPDLTHLCYQGQTIKILLFCSGIDWPKARHSMLIWLYTWYNKCKQRVMKIWPYKIEKMSQKFKVII